MIEIWFSIILGFAITSTLCGLIADNSRGDYIMMRILVCLVVLASLMGYADGETTSVLRHAQTLVISTFTDNLLWFLLGASVAIAIQLIVEGHINRLWIRFHPGSAPTPEARFGRRAQPVARARPVAATLVGTSTEYLNAELDLRTDTLIRLCFYAFEDRGALTLSRLEANLRLGTGHRQKAFHKIAARMRKRPKLKPTIHRYSRSVNGSIRMSQGLFSDLCRMARDTQNQDSATVGRLTQAGRVLGLSDTDVVRLINGSG